MTERELIDRLIHGSYDAFDELYRLHSQQLYSFCMAYTKSEADSEDIVQETFIKIWSIHSGIRPADNLRPLLFTIAKNKIIDSFKKAVNSQAYLAYLKYSISGDYDTADNHSTFVDFMKEFESSLKPLSSVQRKVVRMSRIQGMSNKEISEALGLSLQTIKNYLSVSTKLIKTAFSDKD